MEDVLAVYTRPRDPDRPLVCLDETSKQLLAETRVPIPLKPGRPARHDYEYDRNGTANLFMLFAPLEGWRHVKVTDRHTAVDYAYVLKDLADIHFSNARTIVLVQDNLNIHSKASLYEAFPAAEARRLVERFEWNYTPKHGSWLDLAESELGVLTSQCPRSPHSRQSNSHRGNRRLGARPQCQPHQGRLAIHHKKCSHQTQASVPCNLTESGD
jgi:DDE superfamily endonuclease